MIYKDYQIPTIVKIYSLYDSLSNADKKICDYIIKNAESIIHLTITEVAERTGVSEATVVRTSKKLGYNGF